MPQLQPLARASQKNRVVPYHIPHPQRVHPDFARLAGPRTSVNQGKLGPPSPPYCVGETKRSAGWSIFFSDMVVLHHLGIKVGQGARGLLHQAGKQGHPQRELGRRQQRNRWGVRNGDSSGTAHHGTLRPGKQPLQARGRTEVDHHIGRPRVAYRLTICPGKLHIWRLLHRLHHRSSHPSGGAMYADPDHDRPTKSAGAGAFPAVRGRRHSALHRPIAAKAAFTGTGLL